MVGSRGGTAWGGAIPAPPERIEDTERGGLLASLMAGLAAPMLSEGPLPRGWSAAPWDERVAWYAHFDGAVAALALCKGMGLDVDGMDDDGDWRWYTDVPTGQGRGLMYALREAGCAATCWG